MAEFVPVYQHSDGLDVVLEVAERSTASGMPYLHHRLRVGEGGAVVVARRGDAILFGRSRRDAAEREMWELPRGFSEERDRAAADPGVATAVRELREETGYEAVRPRRVGEFVLDTAIYPQRVCVVDCTVEGAPHGDVDGEVDALQWYAISELGRLIASGAIGDAQSLAALALWRVSGVQEEL